MTDPKPPTEIKVPQAAAGGAGLGALSQLIVWVLGCWVWGASWDADKVTTAIAAVPSPVSIVIGIAFTYVGAYYFGWRAPHTHRPDLIDETLPVIKPVAIDDQVTAQLDKIDASIDKLDEYIKADRRIVSETDHGLSILGDAAHD